MSEVIIASLISAFVTLIVCIINNHFQTKQADKKYNETINLIDYKLSELTKRVDKHNNVVERTYRLEELAAVYEEKISVANHRIDDLERKG